jgi:hypothetical protein
MTSINKKHRGKGKNNSNAAATTPWPAFSRKKIGNFFYGKNSELYLCDIETFFRKKIGNFFPKKIEYFFPKKDRKLFFR